MCVTNTFPSFIIFFSCAKQEELGAVIQAKQHVTLDPIDTLHTFDWVPVMYIVEFGFVLPRDVNPVRWSLLTISINLICEGVHAMLSTGAWLRVMLYICVTEGNP